MEKRIYTILEEIRPEQNFEESENYIEEGLLDSFDIVTLIDSLESEYDIVIDGMDILPENFANIKSIIELITKYLN